jgi:MSHA biogenesis protein MshO
MRAARGFTLIELVVALTLAAIVAGFAATMIGAPLRQYDQQTQRVQLVAAATDAWPLLREDLRTALPNSARARRNGTLVALEILNAVDWVRYKNPPSASFATAGQFRGLPLPYSGTAYHLSVNNLGTGVPGADAWALSGSMTPAGTTVTVAASATPGEQTVGSTPAPVFTADSPRRRIYLVSGPVTWLCDESAGTLRRYSGYSIATNHAARDTAAELLAAGASARLVAENLTACDFIVGPGGANAGQIVTARITAARNGENLQLVQQAALENLP